MRGSVLRLVAFVTRPINVFTLLSNVQLGRMRTLVREDAVTTGTTAEELVNLARASGIKVSLCRGHLEMWWDVGPGQMAKSTLADLLYSREPEISDVLRTEALFTPAEMRKLLKLRVRLAIA